MLQDIPRPGLWKRLLLGSLLVIFASAGAAAVAGFHEVDKVSKVFQLSAELKLGKGTLATTDPGKPQTLMILGSDRRQKDNAEGALESPAVCASCHGDYDRTLEPSHNWRGSMMANATRDPIFWAAVAVAWSARA